MQEQGVNNKTEAALKSPKEFPLQWQYKYNLILRKLITVVNFYKQGTNQMKSHKELEASI